MSCKSGRPRRELYYQIRVVRYAYGIKSRAAEVIRYSTLYSSSKRDRYIPPPLPGANAQVPDISRPGERVRGVSPCPGPGPWRHTGPASPAHKEPLDSR
eukprot:768375-Hanusia_phi.AAC.6